MTKQCDTEGIVNMKTTNQQYDSTGKNKIASFNVFCTYMFVKLTRTLSHALACELQQIYFCHCACCFTSQLPNGHSRRCLYVTELHFHTEWQYI